MREFLTRLVQRQWGQLPAVQPRQPSVFAPATQQPGFPLEQTVPASEPPSAYQLEADLGVRKAPMQNRPIPPTELVVPDLRRGEPPQAQGYRLVGTSPDRPPAEPAQHLHAPLVTKGQNEAQSQGVVSRNRQTTSDDQTEHVRRETKPSPSEGEARVTRDKSPTNGPPERVVRSQAHAAVLPPRLVEPNAETHRSKSSASAPASLLIAPVSVDQAGRRAGEMHEPPVQVTIGRIEVTAVTQAAPAKRAASPRKPAMSLDDYLARRRRRKS